MFSFVVVSSISSLQNSPPLSWRNLLGVPNHKIHFSKMASMIVSGCLFGKILACVNLEKQSTMYRMYFPFFSTLRSIATTSLTSLAMFTATTGVSGLRLLRIHPSQPSMILSIIFEKLGSQVSACLSMLMNACFGRCPSWLCSFCKDLSCVLGSAASRFTAKISSRYSVIK